MARVRSPNYPALSLPEAIQQAAKIFAKEHKHEAPKEVVVKAMGYGGINGASLGALSAVTKYGLVERADDMYHVSERAMAILHPRTQMEKSEAILLAAREPALYAEIFKNFPDSAPSDDNLRAFLVRRGFAPGALTSVIQPFRETVALVTAECGGYNAAATDPLDDDAPPPPRHAVDPPPGAPALPAAQQQHQPIVPPPPPPPSAGFQVSMFVDPNRLVVSGTLLDQERVAALIDVLERIKAVLPPSSSKPATPEEPPN